MEKIWYVRYTETCLYNYVFFLLQVSEKHYYILLLQHVKPSREVQ